MEASDLRVALFSGNYNYTRDGANQTLNLLVGYLLSRGVKVRIYAPTSRTPAFPPVGLRAQYDPRFGTGPSGAQSAQLC
jgi:hypothetical protein